MIETQTHPDIPSILQKIVATKQEEVLEAKRRKSYDSIRAEVHVLLDSQRLPRRGFAKALRQKVAQQQVAIIAEIKKASPSKGVICPNFDPVFVAKQYEHAGAVCLSVLTDVHYFQGDNQYLIAARDACQLPVLRKDFMIHPYQIFESYLLGADCILLIVACLETDALHELHRIACQLGMDVLIEVHTQEELARALTLPDSEHNIYGINNRDLHTFHTNLQTSIALKQTLEAQALANMDSTDSADSMDSIDSIDNSAANKQPCPASISLSASLLLVTESGINNADDMRLMLEHQIYCFLIGEQFMKTALPGNTLAALLQSI